MDNVRRLGDRIAIQIRPDEDGMMGRECPQPDCEGYFKVQSGTGLKGEDLACHCPYCGHTAGHDHFWTKEQIAYAKSVAIRKVGEAFVRDLKELEFEHKPRGLFGIGISMKMKPVTLPPIRFYREKQLETTIVCVTCTLQYAVYGAFAFCPDCGTHNSHQILSMNLDLARRELTLAESQEPDLRRHLVEDALENAVSALDGFGRESVRVHASRAQDPQAARALRFQNLARADDRLSELFGFRLSQAVDPDDWAHVLRAFQKRHVLAHRMGVVDEQYIRESGDQSAVVGRRVPIEPEEVREVLETVSALGAALLDSLSTGEEG